MCSVFVCVQYVLFFLIRQYYSLLQLWISRYTTLVKVPACSWVWCCAEGRCRHDPRTYGAGAGVDTRTVLPHDESMLVLERDRQIVLSVSRFEQLAAGHIQTVHFSGLASATPFYDAMKRLVDRKYLARIERRTIGGNGAGSGQYVYQLGSKGWALARREGRYWPFRAINYHMLAIADVYVALKQSERAGDVVLRGISTEPDTWLTLGGVEVRPDLLVELDVPSKRATLRAWVEVDLGTERQKQIKAMLSRYVHIWQNSTEQVPLVLFLVPDVEREAELKWIIESGFAESSALFRVMQLEGFPGSLT